MASEKVDVTVTTFLNEDTIVAKYQPQNKTGKGYQWGCPVMVGTFLIDISLN